MISLRKYPHVLILTALALNASFVGCVRAASSNDLIVKASYTASSGVIFRDPSDATFMFTAYVAELTSVAIGPPKYEYAMRKIEYKGGEFIEGPLTPSTQKDYGDNFITVQDHENNVIDKLISGLKSYVLFDRNIDDKNLNVSVVRSTANQLTSSIAIQVNGTIFIQKYEGGLVRAVYPINNNDVGVIIDYCGGSSCSSVVEVLAIK